jgi:hypothetical protein
MGNNSTAKLEKTPVLSVRMLGDIDDLATLLNADNPTQIDIFYATKNERLISPCATTRFEKDKKGERLIIGRKFLYGP